MMKTITKLFTMLALNLFTMGTMAAGPYYVNAVQAISGDGKSWNGAFKTLQEALDAATSGDQIYVAKGTYKPTVVFAPGVTSPGSRFNTFKLKSGVAIYGGYSVDEHGNGTRDIGTNETILSGDLNGDDVPKTDADYTTKKADNAYNVVMVSVGTTGVVLDGFTITGGYGNGTDARNDGGASHPAYYGAGILLRNADGTFKNLKIIGNEVKTNTATAYTGGFFLSTTSANLVELDNIEFVENEAGSTSGDAHGGALYIGGQNLRLNRLKFYSNTAKSAGGAIFSSILAVTSNIKLGNSVFYNNEAGTNGGAIYFSASATVTTNATIVNSTFYANKAATSGGSIFLVSNANNSLTLSNAILLGNTATTNADIAKGLNAILTFSNSISQGTTGTVVNTTATADDVFLNTAYGNTDFLKLKPNDTNPAIDGGDNSKYNEGTFGNTDLTGIAVSRKFNSTGTPEAIVDMGAYENIITPLPVVLSAALAAKVSGSAVVLTWATATETNSNHFILEKSIDGVNFSVLANVPSKGSGATYSHTDFSPANGNNYYRLTQVDNNDTKTIYNPVVVNFGLRSSDTRLKIYPNPITGNVINVVLSGYAAVKYNYKLVNTAGTVVQQGSINYNGTGSISIVSNAPAGVYVLYLTSGNRILKTKLVKQ